jgi:hypothetical protein
MIVDIGIIWRYSFYTRMLIQLWLQAGAFKKPFN